MSEEYNWRAEGFRWGILMGAATVILYALIYFSDKSLVLRTELWYGSLLLLGFGMWKAQSPVKAADLKSYIQPGFMVAVVANALFYIYFSVLTNRIDPGLKDLHKELLVAADKANSYQILPALQTAFFDYAMSVVGGFLLAAIIGFVIKSRQAA